MKKLKVKKASLGTMSLVGMAADKLLSNSELARSMTKNLGVAGNLIGNYYEKKANKDANQQSTGQAVTKKEGGSMKMVKAATGALTKSQKKIKKVMGEFKSGVLHSGGKKGPVVKNPKQAIAIALSEAGKSKMKKRGGGIAERGMGSALRGGGEAIAGMGAALKDGGKVFGGKESYDEELGEAKAVVSKKISPKEFVKGEKSEGEKTGEKNTSNIAKKIASGKMSPKQYATMETSEPMKKRGGGMAERGMGQAFSEGGSVRGIGAAIRGTRPAKLC